MERPIESPQPLFHYDAGEPPDLKQNGIDVMIRDLIYQAAPDRGVRAYLVAPAGTGRGRSLCAGLLFLHPSPGSRATFLAETVTLAGMGAVSLLVDAPWTDETAAVWSRVVEDPGEAVQEHIRTIIDLRRGIDLLLARPDLDPDRIGVVGHSLGALMGAVLVGVDRRLKAAVLMAGTGRFADLAALNLPDLRGERLEKYRRTLARLDPAEWIGRAAPAPLLFQSGLRDELFTEEQSREFFERAGGKKSMKWYDAGHYLDEAARRDRIAWLAENLVLARWEPDDLR